MYANADCTGIQNGSNLFCYTILGSLLCRYHFRPCVETNKTVFPCENFHWFKFYTSVAMWVRTMFTLRDEISFRIYMRGRFMSANMIVIPSWTIWTLNKEDYACAIRSILLGEWFHAGMNSHTTLTWNQNEFSYQNQNLAPVQWPGWTRTCLTHSGMTFCAGIL